MTTVLLYLVVAAVIGGLVFVVAMVFFGRGEQLPALAARTSPAQLPARDIRGADVNAVKFSLALRGYRMSDVDWTLERLASELDRTRARLAELEGTADPAVPREPVPAGQVSLTKSDHVDDSLWAPSTEPSSAPPFLTAGQPLRADEPESGSPAAGAGPADR